MIGFLLKQSGRCTKYKPHLMKTPNPLCFSAVFRGSAAFVKDLEGTALVVCKQSESSVGSTWTWSRASGRQRRRAACWVGPAPIPPWRPLWPLRWPATPMGRTATAAAASTRTSQVWWPALCAYSLTAHCFRSESLHWKEPCYVFLIFYLPGKPERNQKNIFRSAQSIYSRAPSCSRGAFDSAKNHKRQRHKRQSVTAKREKSQKPKFIYVRLGQVRLG